MCASHVVCVDANYPFTLPHWRPCLGSHTRSFLHRGLACRRCFGRGHTWSGDRPTVRLRSRSLVHSWSGGVRTLWVRPCHIRNISGTPQVAPGWWLVWLQQCPVANGHVDTGPELTTRRSSSRLSAANSGCASVRVMLCDHARGGMTCDITTTAHTSGVIGACNYAHVSCTIRMVDGVSDKCRRGGR